VEPEHLVKEYACGPELLREAVVGLQDEHLDAVPVPGKWSIRQVICHLADCEIVYADRIKRVLAEENPTISGLCPDAFQRALSYDQRDVGNELDAIQATRRQITQILAQVDVERFQRTAVDSEDGPLTLETLLERITRHIPHHITFIQEKRSAMGVSQTQ